MAGWLRDEGLSPCLQLPPKNCSASAVHQVWCGEGELLPMRPVRQSFVSVYGWARQITYRILAWSQAPHCPTVFPQLFITRGYAVQLPSVSVPLPAMLQHLAQKCHSFRYTIFQMLDLIVNYSLPLLTFISTLYQPYATIPEFTQHCPELKYPYLSSLALLPLMHKNCFPSIF